MSLIIHIETATEVCSVALGRDGALVDMIEEQQAYQHASRLTTALQELVQRNRLNFRLIDAVAVSKGPGSYTGLRIGAAAAKGLCYALNVPLIGISTLQSMALAMKSRVNDPDAVYCPAIDARRDEVYTAIYDFTGASILDPTAHILGESSYSTYLNVYKIYFGGSGSQKISGILSADNAVFIDEVKASAEHMLPLSQAAYLDETFEDLIYFEPAYLKGFKENAKKN